MIRVFLLDDHEVVRRGPGALLESTDDIEVVGRVRVGAGGHAASSPRCGPTSPCSTRACPTATASTCAATSGRRTRRSRP